MNILRVGVANALSVALKLAFSLGTNKVLALTVGPSGFGLVGQVQSLIAMVTGAVNGAVGAGVVKYTAQYGDDETLLRRLWATATAICLLSAFVCGAAVLIFKNQIAEIALGDAQLTRATVYVALGLLPISLNTLILSILNGRRKIGAYIIASTLGSFLASLLTVTLCLVWGLDGALAATVGGQSLSVMFAFWQLSRSMQFSLRKLITKPDLIMAKRLLHYTLMTTVTALTTPASQLVLRNLISDERGWEAAGFWQALLRISDMHIMLITTTLSVYYLPRLAAITDGMMLRREVVRGTLLVAGLTSITASLIFLFRDPLITTLLSKKFIPISNALGIQLLGDVFKVTSWVAAYTMISHARTKTYIASEIIFSLCFLLLSMAMIPTYGLEGIAIAYVVTYAAYLPASWFIMNSVVLSLPPPSENRK